MKRHLNYYIIETFILGIGFFGVSLISGSVQTQAIAMAILVAVYMLMGIVHHQLKHDIHPKIVLEYVVIGALVIAIFVFLKSGIV